MNKEKLKIDKDSFEKFRQKDGENISKIEDYCNKNNKRIKELTDEDKDRIVETTGIERRYLDEYLSGKSTIMDRYIEYGMSLQEFEDNEPGLLKEATKLSEGTTTSEDVGIAANETSNRSNNQERGIENEQSNPMGEQGKDEDEGR